MDSADVTISAKVGTTSSGGGGGGGGGVSGGGGGLPYLTTSVNFSGRAYPLSKVYILKDGNIVVSTIADPQANFSVSFSGLTANTYTFSVYGEDSGGRKSASFSFPLLITSGVTVSIG
ncbi:MAG: hypothetical protein ACREGC_01060, partial [Minisyncoccia bacterium]